MDITGNRNVTVYDSDYNVVYTGKVTGWGDGVLQTEKAKYAQYDGTPAVPGNRLFPGKAD